MATFDPRKMREEQKAKAEQANGPITSTQGSTDQFRQRFMVNGEPQKFTVEQPGTEFTGYATFKPGKVRLVEVRGAWQPVNKDNRKPTAENPAVRSVLTIQLSLRTFQEEIGEWTDNKADPLEAYISDASVFADPDNGWRERLHSIDGKMFEASPPEMARLTQLLGSLHGFTTKKNVQARKENGRDWLFICTASAAPEHPRTGEPIYWRRGAPLNSFTIGLTPPPRTRPGEKPEPKVIPEWNDLEGYFNDLYCGTLHSTTLLLDASMGADEEVMRRFAGVQYSLTGANSWTNAEGEDSYRGKEAPFNGVSLAEPDYVAPSDGDFNFRGGADQGITLDEINAAKPVIDSSGQVLVSAGVASGNGQGRTSRYEDNDD